MNQVTVKRDELLKTVKKNKEAHRGLFLKAQEGYREQVIKELDQMLADARDGKRIKRHITLPEPQDHTEDYNTVITMLEMSVDEKITLTTNHFQAYVLDKWNWKALADLTNTAYAAKRIPVMPTEDY